MGKTFYMFSVYSNFSNTIKCQIGIIQLLGMHIVQRLPWLLDHYAVSLNDPAPGE